VSSRSQPGQRKQQRSFTRASIEKGQPIVFWGGLWAIVFLISITALANLLNPAASKDPQFAQTKMGSSTTTAMQPATTQPATGQAQLPAWLFGAIVLSCGASSLVLARCLSPASAHKNRMHQRTKQRQAQTSKRKTQDSTVYLSRLKRIPRSNNQA